MLLLFLSKRSTMKYQQNLMSFMAFIGITKTPKASNYIGLFVYFGWNLGSVEPWFIKSTLAECTYRWGQPHNQTFSCCFSFPLPIYHTYTFIHIELANLASICKYWHCGKFHYTMNNLLAMIIIIEWYWKNSTNRKVLRYQAFNLW